MDHTEIIQRIIDKKKASTYLEIGVASGKNFLEIKAPRKFGVDPEYFIKFKLWLKHPSNFLRANFYEMTSDDFFKYNEKLLNYYPIDVAFVDGLHTHEQSLKDVENCLQYLNAGGVIVMHDCNPENEEMAQPVRKTRAWTGDVWKTAFYNRTRKDFNFFVLNTDWGVGILTRGEPENILNFSLEEIRKMSYKNLEQNRKDYLNLKEEEYLDRFLLSL